MPSSSTSFLDCQCSCIVCLFFFFISVFYFIIAITLPTISSPDIHSASRRSTSVHDFHILQLHVGNLQPGCYRRDKRRCSLQAARCQILRSACFCGSPVGLGNVGGEKSKKTSSLFLFFYQFCFNCCVEMHQLATQTTAGVRNYSLCNLAYTS